MSVRKRVWITSKGARRKPGFVDYVDQTGKRGPKMFAKKKAADNFDATANVEVRAGVHTADSASNTVADAGQALARDRRAGRPGAHDPCRLPPAPEAAYRALSGQREAFPALGADGSGLRGQARPPRHARWRSLSRGRLLWSGRSASRCPRCSAMRRSAASSRATWSATSGGRRKRGRERQAENRQRGKLKVGVDIPTREEIKAIVEAAKGRGGLSC